MFLPHLLNQYVLLKDRAQRLGISAASEKRIGIAYALAEDLSLAQKAYEACRDFYRDAWEIDPCNYWVITQYLSIIAILNRGDDGPVLKEWRINTAYCGARPDRLCNGRYANHQARTGLMR